MLWLIPGIIIGFAVTVTILVCLLNKDPKYKLLSVERFADGNDKHIRVTVLESWFIRQNVQTWFAKNLIVYSDEDWIRIPDGYQARSMSIILNGMLKSYELEQAYTDKLLLK